MQCLVFHIVSSGVKCYCNLYDLKEMWEGTFSRKLFAIAKDAIGKVNILLYT